MTNENKVEPRYYVISVGEQRYLVDKEAEIRKGDYIFSVSELGHGMIKSLNAETHSNSVWDVVLAANSSIDGLPLLNLPDEYDVENLACEDLKEFEFRDEKEIAVGIVCWGKGFRASESLHKEERFTKEDMHNAFMEGRNATDSNTFTFSPEKYLSPKVTERAVEATKESDGTFTVKYL